MTQAKKEILPTIDVNSLYDSGVYNLVFTDEHFEKVIKLQKNDSATDDPERCVDLWNGIYPDLAKAKLILVNYIDKNKKSTKRVAWEGPYILGTQASDEETAQEVLDIFIRTGRIVIDAMTLGNFLKRTSDNKIICVDVGGALDLESRPGKRRGSDVSFEAWGSRFRGYVEYYKRRCMSTRVPYTPITTTLVQTLLLIKLSNYEIDDVRFLKNNFVLTSQIARFFELLKSEEDPREEIRAILKKCISEEYQRELNHYVTSGGEELEAFKAGLSLRFFGRNTVSENRSVISGSTQESSPQPATPSLREA